MTASDPKTALLTAALPHVAFDGWTETTFRAAIEDSEIDPTVARAICPRGAVDLAVAFHKQGDAELARRMRSEDLEAMRYRDRVAQAVRWRLEIVDDHKEAVRRGTTLFALPQYAGDGAKLIWCTTDVIWDGLGDSSRDYNWYTKRATLSGVYTATVLFWLGDESLDHQETWAFLDRRIKNVMQIEKVKSQARKTPGLGQMIGLGERMASFIRAPNRDAAADLPGQWRGE
ncbi:MAG: COQ9 family protein [Marinovum sp.]|nr:COQ9 family protein [Marinovum sp.]